MTEILGYKGIIVTQENYEELKERFPDLEPPDSAYFLAEYIPLHIVPNLE